MAPVEVGRAAAVVEITAEVETTVEAAKVVAVEATIAEALEGIFVAAVVVVAVVGVLERNRPHLSKSTSLHVLTG